MGSEMCIRDSNQPGPARDIVALNSGAAIYVGGLAKSHKQGVEIASRLIADGSAEKKFQDLIDCSNACSDAGGPD